MSQRGFDERLKEVRAFADIAYWAIRERLEQETGLPWEQIPWTTVETATECCRTTLERLWGGVTRYVRADTLQKLADAAGLQRLLTNVDKPKLARRRRAG